MTILLHLATDTDLPAINARYADVGFAPSHPGKLIVIATSADEFAGQGRIVPIDATTGELGGIHVTPQCQGRGVARQIVDFLIRQTQLPRLYCLPFAQLEPFYRAMGFAPVKEPSRVPRQVLTKHTWCNATYDKPVLLMERLAG